MVHCLAVLIQINIFATLFLLIIYHVSVLLLLCACADAFYLPTTILCDWFAALSLASLLHW